jgi:RHS repeat-associated protein
MLVAKYLYDPYGNTLAKWGLMADVNNYRFSSKEWNANSGLYYYLYRFYDPNSQRWLNRDPINEHGGMNLYGFVNNSPTVWSDGYGLIITPECAAALAALAEFQREFGENPNPILAPQLKRLQKNVDTACFPPTPRPPSSPACPLPPDPYRIPSPPSNNGLNNVINAPVAFNPPYTGSETITLFGGVVVIVIVTAPIWWPKGFAP